MTDNSTRLTASGGLGHAATRHKLACSTTRLFLAGGVPENILPLSLCGHIGRYASHCSTVPIRIGIRVDGAAIGSGVAGEASACAGLKITETSVGAVDVTQVAGSSSQTRAKHINASVLLYLA